MNGEAIEVLSPGLLNRNSGPDFSHATLVIGGTKWVGNVEIHMRSSDWMLHNHQTDRAYESVILHVVYQFDMPVYRGDGSVIPVLIMKGIFNETLMSTYEAMLSSGNKFPCEPQISSVSDITLSSFLSRIIVERFEQKSQEVFEKLEMLKGDWDETFAYFLARNFGFKVNSAGFELLAGSISKQVFSRHKDNALQIEALIFGQAGFLSEEYTEEYPLKLKNEYNFLRKKYGLIPFDKYIWKFLRMRPQNFPTIRLAQFAALMYSSNHLFSKILESQRLAAIYQLFEDLPVNDFWKTHYHFSKRTKHVNLQLGRSSINNIIINTVCLLLFAYGKYADRYDLVDRALDFLENIPAENNSITLLYTNAGMDLKNSFVSQALLQLNKCYCSQKNCLNCGIGIHILKK